MKKTKRKTTTRKPKKPDPVSIQIAIGGNFRGIQPTKAFLGEAANHYAETGRTPKGLEVTVIRWKNPKRKNKALAVWKEARTPAEIKRARRTLRLRQLLRGGMRFSGVGAR